MHIYLLRHAEDSPGRTPGSRGAHHSAPTRLLTKTGRQQAAAAAQWLYGRRPTELHTSSLARARQTAEIVAKVVGLVVREDPRLDEIVSDTVSGGTLPPPRERRGHRHPPGAESWEQFLARVAMCVSDLCRDPSADRRIVLVTHSGFFDAVHELLCGGGNRMELAVAHAGTTHWQYRPGCAAGAWLLHQHNMASPPQPPRPAEGSVPGTRA
jgi:broad specificity phosphatase PhoE